MPAPSVTDAAVAVALAALGQLEVWTSSAFTAEDAVVVAVATLPLAARRQAPVTVLATCVAVLCVLTVQGSDSFTVAQLLGLMLATYTVAAQLPVQRAVVALAVVVPAAWANSASAGSTAAGDYVFPVILLGVPWAAGVAIRRWRERTQELRRLTAALEQERELHARLAVAAERGRIARDLHDSLAQSLNAVVVHAEAAEAALDADRHQVTASLARIQQVGRQSLAETRHLLTALRDGVAEDDVRLADLERVADAAALDGVHVELTVEGDGDCLPAPVQAAVVRIVQEGLANVVKHSEATRAEVKLAVEQEVTLRVLDRGPARPIDPAAGTGSGLGLVGMRERAALLGGSLHAGPAAGGGYLVEARLPARFPA